jgi:hypothetical protein
MKPKHIFHQAAVLHVYCTYSTLEKARQSFSIYYQMILLKCLVADLRLVSSQENYLWIGTDKKIFLCFVSSGLELMTLTQRKFSCPFQSTDNFPEWKLAFRMVLLNGKVLRFLG